MGYSIANYLTTHRSSDGMTISLREGQLSARMRVLKLLVVDRFEDTKKLIWRGETSEEHQYIYGGFCQSWEFQRVAGSSGDRRYRELRDDYGLPVEELKSITHNPYTIEVEDPRTGRMITKCFDLYRLDMTPEEIFKYPWDKVFAKPFSWDFRAYPLRPRQRMSHSVPRIHDEAGGQRSFV